MVRVKARQGKGKGKAADATIVADLSQILFL